MVEIIILTILLLLAAITAASEISIIAANHIKLRRMAFSGSKSAKLILKMLENPERFFGTILVINNVIDSLIAVIIMTIVIRVMNERGNWGIAIATIVSSFLIIIFEVVAKTFAARNSEKMAARLVRPVRTLIIIFSPIVRVFEITTQFIIGLIGGPPGVKPALVTEEEIRALIKIGGEEGILHKEKYKMLSKVFDFSDAVVKDVMTPKDKIVAIDVNAKFEDILNKVLETGYSRVPVYRDNPGNIVGVINMKDLLSLSFNKDLVVLQDIVYPATIVPDSRKVTELLKDFQKGHTHLAVVVNDKDRVEGIVTLEDLLEEIVGEIEDEYDVRTNPYKQIKK